MIPEIKEISDLGVVTLSFNKNIDRVDLNLFRDLDIIKTDIYRPTFGEYDSSLIKSWEVIETGVREIKILLEFVNPLDISVFSVSDSLFNF